MSDKQILKKASVMYKGEPEDKLKEASEIRKIVAIICMTLIASISVIGIFFGKDGLILGIALSFVILFLIFQIGNSS